MEKKQRVRAKNFSLAEVQLLKNEVMKNFSIIQAKHCSGSSSVTKKKQDQAWENICEKVNSLGVAKRSVEEIRKKWRNLTKKAKAEVTRERVSALQTGGGPPAPPVDPLLQDVADPPTLEATEDMDFLAADVVTDNDLFHTQPLFDIVDDRGELDRNEPSSDPQPSTSLCSTNHTSTKPRSCSSGPCNTKKNQSLKELQISFYEAALRNQEAKTVLIQEQIKIFQVQQKIFTKVSSYIDVLHKKLGSKSGEE